MRLDKGFAYITGANDKSKLVYYLFADMSHVYYVMYITILQVKTYIVAPLEGKSHTTSSTIGVMT